MGDEPSDEGGECRRVVALLKDEADHTFGLADGQRDASAARGLYQRAVQLYVRALAEAARAGDHAHSGTCLAVHLNIATIALRLKEYGQAVKHCVEAVRLVDLAGDHGVVGADGPSKARCYYFLGLSLVRRGSVDQGVRALRQAQGFLRSSTAPGDDELRGEIISLLATQDRPLTEARTKRAQPANRSSRSQVPSVPPSPERAASAASPRTQVGAAERMLALGTRQFRSGDIQGAIVVLEQAARMLEMQEEEPFPADKRIVVRVQVLGNLATMHQSMAGLTGDDTQAAERKGGPAPAVLSFTSRLGHADMAIAHLDAAVHLLRCRRLKSSTGTAPFLRKELEMLCIKGLLQSMVAIQPWLRCLPESGAGMPGCTRWAPAAVATANEILRRCRSDDDDDDDGVASEAPGVDVGDGDGRDAEDGEGGRNPIAGAGAGAGAGSGVIWNCAVPLARLSEAMRHVARAEAGRVVLASRTTAEAPAAAVKGVTTTKGTTTKGTATAKTGGARGTISDGSAAVSGEGDSLDATCVVVVKPEDALDMARRLMEEAIEQLPASAAADPAKGGKLRRDLVEILSAVSVLMARQVGAAAALEILNESRDVMAAANAGVPDGGQPVFTAEEVAGVEKERAEALKSAQHELDAGEAKTWASPLCREGRGGEGEGEDRGRGRGPSRLVEAEPLVGGETPVRGDGEATESGAVLRCDGALDEEDIAFTPSAAFRGSREGYVFKTGCRGTGYYGDVGLAVLLRKDPTVTVTGGSSAGRALPGDGSRRRLCPAVVPNTAVLAGALAVVAMMIPFFLAATTMTQGQ